MCYHIQVKLSYKLRISHLATNPNFSFCSLYNICRIVISSSDNSSDEECSEGSCYDFSTDSHDDSSGSEDEIHCLKKPTSPIK